ncbi:hypothetical protein HYO65_gp263 [Tenacibaculum phage PTm1]|uniref:Uncharacterized protein n=2 Tax=Shirahamavirus PTm1 TaxID=2846435 RepID=A0A5S9BZH7_9CAUD|nr:hypothetical protein HYO65_gp263 [Tenacibaculum phage PTm1]BBI90655.1 hypothetical protein [Tenacibaculum phage PTm1]BBI90960.1 hypothetical protein [Tenacibaculum phage PTm5]
MITVPKILKSLTLKSVGDFITLLIFITLTYIVILKLNTINDSIKYKNHTRLEVIDINQCETIVHDLTNRWGANTSALYVLQPKNYKKVYKELVIPSKRHILPTRVSLSNEIEFELELYEQKYVIFNTQDNFNISNDDVCVVIPIYHHRVIIAELYVFFDTYDKASTFVECVGNRTIESQIIGKLIR